MREEVAEGAACQTEASTKTRNMITTKNMIIIILVTEVDLEAEVEWTEEEGEAV